MKRNVYAFVLFFLIVLNVKADNCESVVAKHYYSEYGNDYWDTRSFVVDSLHRIIQINGSEYFVFDSLGRVIKHGNGSTLDSTVFDDFLHIKSTFQVNYSYPSPVNGLTEVFYGANEKDSVYNRYGADINGMLYLVYRSKYLYNLFDSLELILTENYDTVTMMFSLSDSTTFTWAADNLSYSSQVYMIDGSGVAQLDQENSIAYNSSGDIISDYSSGSYIYGWPGNSISYIIQCGKQYISRSSSVGGSGQDYYSENYYYTFDSLCNPVHIDGHHSDNNASYDFSVDYFYGDCNHIFVVPQEVSVCPGQLNMVYPQVLGGSGAGLMTYQWQPADSVSSPNDLYTQLLCTTPQTFSLLVTDPNGHSYNYSLPVTMNTFTYNVTDANCATCASGSIQVFTSNSSSTLTIVPYHSEQFPGVFTNLRPGVYYICAQSSNCTTCDSVTVQDLSTSITELENNMFTVSPNPFSGNLLLQKKSNKFESSSSWKLFEVNGRLLKTGLLNEKEILIGTEDISKGIYFLQITDNSEIHLMKIIKN